MRRVSLDAPFVLTLAGAWRACVVLAAALVCGLSSSPLHAQTTLYWGGGDTNITGPQAPAYATGTWNSTIQNWATDSAGTTYGAWQSGAIANLGSGGTAITIRLEDNLSVGGITTGTGLLTSLPTISAASSRTLTLVGTGGNQPVFSVAGGTPNAETREISLGSNVALAGSGGFRVDGQGTGAGIELAGNSIAHTISGTAVVAGRVEFLNTTSTMLNISRWDFDWGASSSGLILSVSSNNNNRLSDTATVALRKGGRLQFSGTGAQFEVLGTLDISSNNLGTIVTNTTAAKTADTLLAFGSLVRDNYGYLQFNGLQTYSGTVRVGSGIAAEDKDKSLLWATNNTGGANSTRFVQYSSSADSFKLLGNGLGINQDTIGPSDLSTWDSQSYTADTNVYWSTPGTSMSGALDANLSLRTLALSATSANAAGGGYNFNLGGNTLTVRALTLNTQNQAPSITNGTIQAPAGAGELLIYSSGNGTRTISAVLGGSNDIVIVGSSTATVTVLSSTSTYTGAMRIHGSTSVQLQNAGVKVTGDLYLEGRSALEFGTGALTTGNAITGVVYMAPDATIRPASIFTGNQIIQTIGGLSGSGTVQLGTNGTSRLTVNAAANHTYSGQIAGAGALVKSGASNFTLSGGNTYTGTTSIESGTLTIGGGGTTGSIASTGTVAITSGAVLNFNRTDNYGGAFANRITGTGSVRVASGTLALSNAGNGYTGGSTIAGAGSVLEYGNLSALGTGTVTFTGAGTLRAGAGGTFTNAVVMTSAGTLDNGGLAQSLSGVISGAGNVSFAGTGTTTLTALNTYTGTTNLTAGTLLVNGTNSGGSPVNVLAGAVLAGSGRIDGLVDVAGALAPGDVGATGLLTAGSLSLGSTALTTIQISGTNPALRGVDFDAIDLLAGGPTYGGSLFFDFTFGTLFGEGTTTFDIFSFSGSPSGGFTSVSGNGGVYGALSFTNNAGLWTTTTSDPSTTIQFNQATGDVQFVVVPEPGALAICGIGVVVAAWRLRRRRA